MGEEVTQAEQGYSDKAPTSDCGQGTEPTEDGFPPPRPSAEKSLWGVRRRAGVQMFSDLVTLLPPQESFFCGLLLFSDLLPGKIKRSW